MRNRELSGYDRLLSGNRGDRVAPFSTFVEMATKVASPPKALTIVDYGCGTGKALQSLVTEVELRGMRVIGLGLDNEIGERLKRIRLLQCDLNADEWPLSQLSVNAAISNKTAMFLVDKMRFLERVWSHLVVGGIAILEVDVGISGLTGLTPRIHTPRPFPALVSEQMQRGIEIVCWQAECPLIAVGNPPRDSCVVGMRRTSDSLKLAFGLQPVQSQAFRSEANEIESWGTETTYVDA